MLTFNSLGRYGRMGNAMFQVASVIGVATKNGYDYGFPLLRHYDHLERFGTKEDIDIYKHFLNPLPECNIQYPDKFIHWGFQGFNVPDNHSLSGHMQSEKYFEHCKELIKYYFTFKDKLPLQNKLCCHLRLGDYDNNYHPIMTWEYYREALSRLPDMPVIVFSDDIELAKKLIFGDNIEYSEGRDTIEDFKLMMSCKHFIIANSTYSWWAAWLGGEEDKVVVSPHHENWFGKIAGLDAKDIIPDNWIQIKT